MSNPKLQPKPSGYNYIVSELQVSYKTNIKGKQPCIHDARDAHRFFKKVWDKNLMQIQEQVCAIFLKANNEVIAYRTISTGTLSSSNVDTPLIVALALQTRANSVIIAHNHPSGNRLPSSADCVFTKKLKQQLELFDILIIDHLIITKTGYDHFGDSIKNGRL
jgi:DNA repair protein RadC